VTHPLSKAGTRKARSVLDCQLKKKKRMVGSMTLCVYERYLYFEVVVYKMHTDNTKHERQVVEEHVENS
jgi:hypothetical protein